MSEIEVVDDDYKPNVLELALSEGATLPALCRAMLAIDEGVIPATVEQKKELGKKILTKVDGYHHIEKAIDSSVKLLDAEIKPLQARKKTLNNMKDTLRECAKYAMEEGEAYKLPGRLHGLQMVISKGRSVKFKQGYEEPNAQLYMRFSKFIKRTYAWDKEAVRLALKSGDNQELNEIAQLEDSKSLRWFIADQFSIKGENE